MSGTMIEARSAGHPRDRNPEVLPVALGRITQLFEGGSQHVLDNHHAGVGSEDQPLGTYRAVCDITDIFVQQCDRRHHLTDQTEGAVDVEPDVFVFDVLEHLGQPNPGVRSDTKASVDPPFSRSTPRTRA